MIRFLNAQNGQLLIPETSIKIMRGENWADGMHYVVYYEDEKGVVQSENLKELKFLTFEN